MAVITGGGSSARNLHRAALPIKPTTAPDPNPTATASTIEHISEPGEY
ncbi:MAG: hypothetical protein ACREUA_08975 [Burkholderiales bacterium]